MKLVFKDNTLLKNIIELFKDAVQNANIKCCIDGIYLQAMDSSHVSMASFKLSCDVFTLYECNEDVILGLDLEVLYKILKVITKDDILEFHTDREDLLTIRINNKSTDKEFEFDMKLMVIDAEELEVPPHPDGWRVVIDSGEFFKNMSIMADFGDSVTIGSTDGKMYFKVDGDSANATIGDKTESTWDGDALSKTNVMLKFSTRLVKQYGSGRKITSTIKFILAPEHPIIIQYEISENSYISMFIAPKISDMEE